MERITTLSQATQIVDGFGLNGTQFGNDFLKSTYLNIALQLFSKEKGILPDSVYEEDCLWDDFIHSSQYYDLMDCYFLENQDKYKELVERMEKRVAEWIDNFDNYNPDIFLRFCESDMNTLSETVKIDGFYNSPEFSKSIDDFVHNFIPKDFREWMAWDEPVNLAYEYRISYCYNEGLKNYICNNYARFRHLIEA